MTDRHPPSRLRHPVQRVRQAIMQLAQVFGFGFGPRGVTKAAQIGAGREAGTLLLVFGNPGQAVRGVGLLG
ncbi:hypothetical protein G6F56_014652 [Rhizopus delemar]|nr:hypothetical protein G6F56_014652 [Rhizopus delemar]